MLSDKLFSKAELNKKTVIDISKVSLSTYIFQLLEIIFSQFALAYIQLKKQNLNELKGI
jgi:hypothetical protein